MIVLNILGYFGRNKQNSYAALISLVKWYLIEHFKKLTILIKPKVIVKKNITEKYQYYSYI